MGVFSLSALKVEPTGLVRWRNPEHREILRVPPPLLTHEIAERRMPWLQKIYYWRRRLSTTTNLSQYFSSLYGTGFLESDDILEEHG